jgi:glycosyltransferase involved in cell wall biosynthesis
VSKKVLLVCSDATSLKNFRGSLISDMRNAGHQVVTLAPDYPKEVQNWCDRLGVVADETKLNNQSLNPFRDMIGLFHLISKIREHKPDVVMGYVHKPAIYTAIAAWIARVPRVTMMVTGMGFAFESGPGLMRKIIPFVTRALFKTACAASDMVIFHNGDIRTYFLKYRLLKKSSASCVVGGSGIDLAHFKPLALPKHDAGQTTFLLVARIIRYKGVLEYANAAQAISQRYPAARFLLAGFWDANPIAYSAEEWAFIQQHVTYVGKSNDVRALYAQADVYVLPSYGEGLPRTVLEAMASSRPVITTDTYGCRDTVKPGVNGFLVPVGEWEPLRDAMMRFVLEPALISTMGKRSLAMARETFDVKIVNRDMLAALDL